VGVSFVRELLRNPDAIEPDRDGMRQWLSPAAVLIGILAIGLASVGCTPRRVTLTPAVATPTQPGVGLSADEYIHFT
jgi:hypothetical protein